MYNIKNRMASFKIDNANDIQELEEIINNPLCTITNKQFITTENKTFNDKGKLDSIVQEITCVLEWNEKELLL